jgi:H+/gluconate symporter-like permease
VVSLLLSVTFACGLVIAVAHVLNKNFIAPGYDVIANLTAFSCAVAASALLGHWVPAMLSSIAIACWLLLARRTVMARRALTQRPVLGSPEPEHFRTRQ